MQRTVMAPSQKNQLEFFLNLVRYDEVERAKKIVNPGNEWLFLTHNEFDQGALDSAANFGHFEMTAWLITQHKLKPEYQYRSNNTTYYHPLLIAVRALFNTLAGESAPYMKFHKQKSIDTIIQQFLATIDLIIKEYPDFLPNQKYNLLNRADLKGLNALHYTIYYAHDVLRRKLSPTTALVSEKQFFAIAKKVAIKLIAAGILELPIDPAFPHTCSAYTFAYNIDKTTNFIKGKYQTTRLGVEEFLADAIIMAEKLREKGAESKESYPTLPSPASDSSQMSERPSNSSLATIKISLSQAANDNKVSEGLTCLPVARATQITTRTQLDDNTSPKTQKKKSVKAEKAIASSEPPISRSTFYIGSESDTESAEETHNNSTKLLTQKGKKTISPKKSSGAKNLPINKHEISKLMDEIEEKLKPASALKNTTMLIHIIHANVQGKLFSTAEKEQSLQAIRHFLNQCTIEKVYPGNIFFCCPRLILAYNDKALKKLTTTIHEISQPLKKQSRRQPK